LQDVLNEIKQVNLKIDKLDEEREKLTNEVEELKQANNSQLQILTRETSSQFSTSDTNERS